jgi:hypothetical protein
MFGSARGREGKLRSVLFRKKGGLGGQNAAQYILLCLDIVRGLPGDIRDTSDPLKTPAASGLLPQASTSGNQSILLDNPR